MATVARIAMIPTTTILCLALALAGDPTLDTADEYVARGMRRFRDNDIKGSLRDFDRAADIEPRRARYLWQRGISHYYLVLLSDQHIRMDARSSPNHFSCQPVITWPYEDDLLNKLDEGLRCQNDVIIEKSRDMGVTWCCILKFLHSWLYWPETSFFVMSRVSDLVDKRGNPSSIFWRIDCVLKHLPSWMTPNYDRTEMHLENRDINTSIDGASTTGEAGVGGWNTGAFFDEFPLVKDDREVWIQSAAMTNCQSL